MNKLTFALKAASAISKTKRAVRQASATVARGTAKGVSSATAGARKLSAAGRKAGRG